MEYKKITAGFFDKEINFCIYNLPKKQIDNIPYSLLLTENIIKRGIPTKLSYYLRHALGEHYTEDELNKNYSPCFISEHKQTWTRKTILGNSSDPSDNPAETFFQNIDKDLADYGFISKITIPEFEIIEYCPDLKYKKELNPKTRVDFFIPTADLIIEIDGKQHNENLDKIRDDLFDKYNIKTIRISTASIRKRNSDYYNKINEIKEYLKNSHEIKKYQISLKNKIFKTNHLVYVSTAIIRFQVLLIELLKSGEISFKNKNWKFNINVDFRCDFDWAKIALEDLFEWLTPISNIFEDSITQPTFDITYNSKIQSNEMIEIDVKLFEKPDEKQIKKLTIKSYYLDTFKVNKNDNHYIDFNLHPPLQTNNKKINEIFDTKKSESLHKVLFQMFGYKTFNEGQIPIINNILFQENTLGILPTGAGKSLCFQIPSMFQLGCSIVICPIKALMNDHVDELNKYGFKNRSEYIHGDLDRIEKDIVFEKIKNGQTKFLFISPERFQTENFRSVIKQLLNNNLISYIVIDEVHCLSEWGHDFRTSYLALANTIVSILKIKVPIIALTATASNFVIENIKSELNINNVLFRMHNSRPELNYKIIKTNDKITHLEQIIDEMKEKNILTDGDAGIVFTMHVNSSIGCMSVEQSLNRLYPDIKTGVFCGDEPVKWKEKRNDEKFDQYKARVQKEYKANEIELMCATKSFGMGVNKPNIRFSVHYGMPQSMESLYQEAGRTGRDKRDAKNIILFKDETEKIPDIIFDQNTKVEILKEYCNDQHLSKRGDFRNQLWLFTDKKQTIEDELKSILFLLNQFAKENISPIEIKVNKQIYLYRLYQLGVVSDWMVTDFFQNKCLVYYQLISDEEFAINVLNQIKKYEKSSSEIEFHENEMKMIFKLNPAERKKNIISYLLQWNNDNFLYNRRQSLKTLYDYTKDFEKTGAEEFKRKIEAYFKVNDQTTKVEQFIESDFKFAPTYLNEVLKEDGKMISTEKVKEYRFILARFLESYQSNPWLNLLSSVCRLITNSFDDPDGKARLYIFLKDAKKKTLDWKTTLENLLDFAKILKNEEKLLFSQAIEPHLDTIDELVLLHNYLQDDYSAIKYLEKFNKRLKNVF